MAQMTFPITIGTNDGHVERTLATNWPPATSTFVNFADNFLYSEKSNWHGSGAPDYRVGLTLLAFDTSALPDEAIIQGATLRFWPFEVLNEGGYSLAGDWYNWGGTTADYTLSGGTNALAPVSLSSIVQGATNELTLSGAADNVSRTGVTKLRIHVPGGQPVVSGSPNRNRLLMAALGHPTLPASELVVTYTINPAPLQGSWISPVNGAAAGTLTPLFQGTMPHPAEDQATDYTTAVHLQVYRSDTGAMAHDAEIAVTASEQALGYFSKSPVTLTQGVLYKAKFRHKDSFGAYSPFSAEVTFAAGVGPRMPTVTFPLTNQKITTQSPTYTGSYSHESGLSANAIQVQLWNAAGTSLIHDSGTIAKTVADGASWSQVGTHPALSWGTSYQVWIRLRDTNNIWSPYAKVPFRTNAPPYVPSNLQPGSNAQTASTTLSAVLADPDFDVITQVQSELFDITANAMVATFPKNMVITGNSATLDILANVIVDHQYRWRARAYDGILFSNYSEWATFTYRTKPAVALLGPGLTGETNLIRRPSPERQLAVASTFWTETGRTASSYTDVVNDGDAAFGDSCWRAVASATSGNLTQSEFMTVDATKPYYLLFYAKKESGTSVSHARIDCYTSANAYIDSVYPSSIRACQALDLPSAWTSYGGIVWNTASANTPKFPATTAKVKVFWQPSASSACVTRWDAFLFEQVASVSAADWTYLQAWQGYLDGDSPKFDPRIVGAGYDWGGTPGDSTSTGVNVLRGVTPRVVISYTHASSRPMTAHRIQVRQPKASGDYKGIYDSGWLAQGALSAIPLPSGTLKNEARYEIAVDVRDDLSIEGSSAWIPVDVRYEGPPELVIASITGDVDRAEVTLSWEESALPSTSFGGIELAVGDATGDPATAQKTIVDLLTTPTANSWTYPYPIARQVQGYYVRQVEVRGADIVQGPWRRGILNLNHGEWWLKSIEDPHGLMLPVKVYVGDEQAIEESAPMTAYVPWGEDRTVHIVSPARSATGTLVVRLLDGDADNDAKVAMIREIARLRPTMALLSQRPPERRFVVVTGVSQTPARVPEYAVYEISFEASAYEESFYDREGA